MSKDSGKSKAQLLDEVHALQQRVKELESAVADQKHDEELSKLKWLLRPDVNSIEPYEPPYGDLVALNTSREIADAVDPAVLRDIAHDYLALLGTSSAIYEKNGDYAYGIFSSGWCRLLDGASRKLCNTDDDAEALSCGKWLCHESCWTDVAKVCIETGEAVDRECHGGIRMYAAPIRAAGEVVGAINFGYGDPPQDEKKLQEIANKYCLSIQELRENAEAYQSRPPFIIDMAKERLHSSARMIGVIVERRQIEEMLKKNEERFRLAQQASQIGTWEHDLTTDKVYCSDNVESMFGVESGTFSKNFQNFLDCIIPEDRNRVEKEIAAALEKGQGFTIEYRIVRPDGTVCWITDKAGILEFTAGKPTRLIGTVCDITDRRRAEMELRQQGILLDQMGMVAKIGGWEMDLKTREATWTRGTYDIVEIEPGQHIPGPDEHVSYYLPQYQDMVASAMQALIEDDTPLDFEAELRTAKGNIKWCRALGRSERKDGVCVSVYGTFQDITARKQAEERIKKQQYYLEAAQQLGQIGTWELDLRKNELIWTDENCRIFGVPVGSVVNYEIFIEKVHPDDRDYVDREWNAALAGKPYDIEHRIQIGGNTRWVREKANVDFDEKGVAVKAIGFTQDITEKKIFEEALKESEARFKSMFEKHDAIMLLIAPDTGRIINANRAASRFFDYSPDELLRMSIDDINILPAEQVAADRQRAVDFIQNRFIFQHRLKNGEVRDVEVHSTPIEQEGQLVLFSIIHDITDRKRAEDELRYTTELLNETGDMARVGGWEVDLETDTVFWTHTTKVIHEVPDDYVPTLEAALGFFPEVKEEFTEVFRRAREEGVPYDLELPFVSAKGRKLWTHTIGKPEFRDGKCVRLHGTFQDITEQRNARIALQKSEERFRLAQLASKAGTWERDLKTDEVHWSDNVERMFGMEPGAFSENFQAFLDCVLPEDRNRIGKEIAAALKKGRGFTVEYRIVRPDGTLRWMTDEAEIFQDVEGKPRRLVGVVRDITERKRAEAKLRAVEKRNRALLDHSPVCHKIVDLDFNLQYMSLNGFKMLQLEDNADVYGKPYPFAFFPEDFRQGIRDCLEQVKITGKTLTFEGVAADIKGNEVYFHSTLVPVFNDDDVLDYITVVTVDLTAEKQLEAELRQSQKLEAVGHLAGGVAHDFNNMLNVILGNAEFALEGAPKDDPLQDSIAEIKQAAHRSADLTRQLLAFARKQTVVPKVLDLNETIASMIKMLNRLMSENINVVWKPTTGIKLVKVDPAQVDQMLANLVVNARDAIGTKAGDITIETGMGTIDEDFCNAYPDLVPGDYVTFAVSDDGCGMDEATRQQIFEPFFTTKDTGKGTGLGLSTVYGIVRQNNGIVNVYSEPGKGTTFRIYLPVYEDKEDTSGEKSVRHLLKPGEETILLVEDEPAILRMTTKMLTRMGYKVIAAHTPGEAMNLAEAHDGQIDLLITDVVMPEMNGREIANRIMTLYPDMKQLFMSGYTADIIAHHGVVDEGMEFIQKPFTKNDLQRRVREILDA